MAAARPSQVDLAEFNRLFESLKNWGVWGQDDQLGTLNYLTPDRVAAAARLVRTGRRVSMEFPISKTPAPDNPNPPVHMVTLGHDIDVSSGESFGLDFLGMACHGEVHSHVDALCHIAYKGQTYNGKPALEVLKSTGATTMDVTAQREGIVGRGVLLDIPRLKGVPWLEPGEAVTAADLEACEKSEGVTLGEGDILVLRTGHFGRRAALGPWDVSAAGIGRAGLALDTLPWMKARRIAAFWPDGDGELVPSQVDGMLYPIHPLQIVAMGLAAADALYLEDVAKACEEEGRWEFMAIGLPLQLPGGTGSPWNPVAIF